jgi:hypothetical protein
MKGKIINGRRRGEKQNRSKMAVNETLLGSTMTNFTLPSPKRHRKYEETGTIHDEVTIHYSVVCFAGRLEQIQEGESRQMSFRFTFHRDIWLYSF